MNVEARFVGGPAEGEERIIPDLMHEVKVAFAPPPPRGWWEESSDEDPFPRVPYEEHTYRPVRVIAYYEHSGMEVR